MNFERGKDPKEAIGIGREAILKEIGGVILNDEEFAKWKDLGNPVDKPWFSATSTPDNPENVVIHVFDGKFEIIKNLIRFDDEELQKIRLPKGLERDLINILLKLREGFRKYGAEFFQFPTIKKVSARTIGQDLVSVQPMSAPMGILPILDIQYSRKNKLNKLLKAK
jgi:hypothetical protein